MLARYKLIVYCPIKSAELIRKVLGEAGAGHIGSYDFASFSSRGIGRFRPLPGANPNIGKVGEIAEVEEERIEVIVDEANLEEVLSRLRKAHPYEEPAIEVIPLFSPPQDLGRG